MPELPADIAVHVQHPHKLVHAVPVKQDQMLVLLGIRRERHRDHVDQRDDIKDQNADAGKCHQRNMKVPVEQVLHILSEVRNRFPFFHLFLKLVRMQQLQDPEPYESCDHKAGDHAKKQDLL